MLEIPVEVLFQRWMITTEVLFIVSIHDGLMEYIWVSNFLCNVDKLLGTPKECDYLLTLTIL